MTTVVATTRCLINSAIMTITTTVTHTSVVLATSLMHVAQRTIIGRHVEIAALGRIVMALATSMVATRRIHGGPQAPTLTI